jgi:hypothetical protein
MEIYAENISPGLNERSMMNVHRGLNKFHRGDPATDVYAWEGSPWKTVSNSTSSNKSVISGSQEKMQSQEKMHHYP